MRLENIILDKKDIEYFLKRIEVERAENAFIQLTNIIQGILKNIPFNNFFLLRANGVPASYTDIIENMLTCQGGLCDIMNPFLFILLKSMGYHVSFMSASMEKKNCHIILKIELNRAPYLVDVGNGSPYFEPIKLDKEKTCSDKVYTKSLFSYKLHYEQCEYVMLHKFNNNNWEKDFAFFEKGVHHACFAEMLYKQYNQIGWGPFLSSIQAKKWTDKGGLIIRNKLFWDSEKNIKKRISNPKDLKECLGSYFQIEMDLRELSSIWEVWNENYGKRNENAS